MDTTQLEQLRGFILDGLADDEERVARGDAPLLADAEARGRFRVLRSDDGQGFLLVPGDLSEEEDGVPASHEEKLRALRSEVENTDSGDVLQLVASAYEGRHGWLEEWRAATP
ncbi:hypothetical protein ACFFSW_29105 [Saccharothrix longispora]|uniref:Uncharacterized protein n=1 Tax=Saccharothrix longispora TaxID=33920 RepID=A0ABU1PRU1_9PSEU|nr:hypothetical protein [Saccharothrix longispora]MDR6593371.1 hypothetical protein [Saccharothrix longispora]